MANTSKDNFPKNFSLKGMKIVIDCANGAGYKSAPKILSSLGAKVFSLGVKPNGLNINNKCGSTYPSKIQSFVKKYKANIGMKTKIMIGLRAWICDVSHSIPRNSRSIISACKTQAEPV